MSRKQTAADALEATDAISRVVKLLQTGGVEPAAIAMALAGHTVAAMRALPPWDGVPVRSAILEMLK